MLDLFLLGQIFIIESIDNPKKALHICQEYGINDKRGIIICSFSYI